jgi:hypothetical protein
MNKETITALLESYTEDIIFIGSLLHIVTKQGKDIVVFQEGEIHFHEDAIQVNTEDGSTLISYSDIATLTVRA